MRQVLGNAARWFVRRTIRLYYPQVEVTGREHIPRTGAVLLAANHANSLLDPVIVGIAAQRPVCFFAKAPLFNTPVLGPIMRALGMIPAFRAQDNTTQVRRNLDSLHSGADALARGEVVGIFPEGKSHDALKLEQIRSGAARMAIQAVQRGARDLRLVPIGINYQRKQQFRSAVWVRIAEPIAVAEFIAPFGDEEKKALRALTAEIETRLKHCVIQLREPAFASFLDELELLLPAARERGRHPIPALRQRKSMADAMNYFLEQDHTRAEAMAQAIREYRSHLLAAQLTSRSPIMRWRGWRLAGALTLEALWLGFWFPAAAAGTLFHFIPFHVTRAIARKLEDGPTTTALTRLGVGIPLYAIWYAAAWLALHSYFLPWVAWTVVSLMPLAGILALTYIARAPEICANWVNQVRLLTRPAELQTLRTEQSGLRKRLKAFALEFFRMSGTVPEQPRPILTRDRVKLVARWACIFVAAASVFVWQNWWIRDRGQHDRFPGLNLAGMSSNSLHTALSADETALLAVLEGLNDLEAKARLLRQEFEGGQRNWYRQADNDAIRHLMLSYVNYRTALLRLAWKYSESDPVQNESLRLRAFLVSYTAASTLYAASLQFVSMFELAPNAVRKLNEAEPQWDIPPGLYDTIRRNLADPRNRDQLNRARTEYAARHERFKALQLDTAPPFGQLHLAATQAGQRIGQLSTAATRAGVVSPVADAIDTGKTMAYRAQSFISTWIGDTKVRAPRQGQSLIRPEQVSELRPLLEPGDVLLERRNWFLSNAFLPGYWPHTALYVGRVDDLRRLGLDSDPRVARHWDRFIARDSQGHEHVILEAVSEGIVFTSLEHSVGEADAAAVLRPRLAPAEIREAIARAFSHVGKPYDFEFDFFSTDKLVCTELVYRAYDGHITFPLVTIMGTRTLPAIEIVRKYANERSSGNPQFEFIRFLDGHERKGRAHFADEEAFLSTLQRPALTWLQGLAAP